LSFDDTDLRAKLHYAHIDAIELGANDCSYDVIEDQPTSAICHEMHEDNECFYIVDPIGLLHAVQKCGLKPDHRTILLLSEKDNSMLDADFLDSWGPALRLGSTQSIFAAWFHCVRVGI